MTLSFLTSSTSIPSAVRGKVRSFVKAHSLWMGWIASKGIESREAKNSHLLEFAIAHGIGHQVLSIINGAAFVAPAAPIGPAPIMADTSNSMGPFDSYDERDAMLALVKQEEEAHALIHGSPVKVDDLLSTVDQFLSPFVRAEIEKVLAPVIAAANKPAIEVEKIVYQQAMPVAPTGALPYAQPGNQIRLDKLFNIKSSNPKAMVTLWEAHGAAPAVDPFFVVDAKNMAQLATAIERGSNVWLGGPAGSGKSTLPEQFAAYTGRPFTKLGFTKQSNVDDQLGGTGVKAGDTGWVDGVLIQAVRRPGMVILLDEITLAPPGVQGLFQGIADDHRTIFLSTGEKVTCAPGVVFVVADNTFGYGDETGQYHGTHAANGALVNRFKRMLKVDYLTTQQEAQALHNHTRAPLAACLHVAEFAARARKLPAMDGVILSLRNMVGLVQDVQDGFPVKEAAEVTMLNRLPATERAALEVLFTLTWEGEFETLMQGQTLAQQPSNSAGAAAFDDEVSASLTR